MTAREDGQAFWDSFASVRGSTDAADTATLALRGYCPVYDSYRDRAERIAVRALLPSIDPNWRVLDIGCGPGRWTLAFASAGAHVTAVDFSAAMLEHARRRCENARVSERVTFRTGRLEELHSAGLAGPFDLVLAMGIIQYVAPQNLADVAVRIAQCVAPGGRFLHRETLAPKPFGREALGADGGLKTTSYYKSFEQYRDAFAAAGLEFRNRRSIIPPSLALSLLQRAFPCERNARNAVGRGLYSAAIAVREYCFDPLLRLSPELLWRINARRPTDQAAILYTRPDR